MVRASLTVAMLAGAAWLTAQAALVCPRTQTYQPGERLVYDLQLHSELALPGLTDSGRIDTIATVEMTVAPGGGPGAWQADMRYSAFDATVQAAPAALADLKSVAAAYSAAALSMPPARVLLGRDAHLLRRPPGDQYDQGLTMLQDLAYGGSLPTSDVRVGDSWTVQRSENVPALHAVLPSTLQVKLVGFEGGAANLQVHSEGSVDLPLDQVPNRAEAMAQGLVPKDTVSFTSDGTERFRLSDGVLLAIESHSQNRQHETFTGVKTQAPIDQVVSSNSTIKLRTAAAPQ